MPLVTTTEMFKKAYSGGYAPLLKNIARDEWGYMGWFVTDMINGADYMNWRDIVAISAGGMHSIGLKADGTVVAAGDDRAFPGISRWTDIIAVSGGSRYTIGLKADGTAVAVGTGNYGETSIFTWSNLVAVCAGNTHTVGLCSDGTLVAVGRTDYHQCDLSSWQGIKLPN